TFLPPTADHRLHLPSFPTRRSSDLNLILHPYLPLRVCNVCHLPRGFQYLHASSLEYARYFPNDSSLSARSYSLSRPKTHSIDLRSEEHTSELQSRENLVCRLLLEKK